MNKGAALTEHTDRAERRATGTDGAAAVRLEAASLAFGDRTLWRDLDL